MNWIHCNKCSSIPTAGKCSFWLTSCGHVFCGDCVGVEKGDLALLINPTRSIFCFACHHNVKAVQIRRGMDNNAAMLFRPPNEMLQKTSQEMYKIGEIVKFQAWQSSSFQRLRKDASYENYYKQLLYKNRDVIATKQRELEKANREIQQMAALLEDHKKEIRQLKNNATICIMSDSSIMMPPPIKRQKYPTLNGPSPFSTPLSFCDCKTSTPIMSDYLPSNTNMLPSFCSTLARSNSNNNNSNNILQLLTPRRALEESMLAGRVQLPGTPLMIWNNK
uniref:RING-type domain-containing protein n=2 Tax=Meloidogyne enterolobii TaxID=390850 RepID=A0A6V7UBJ8_MELEN|nr:unnamed protein product [Meloidogyne enterolobii]